MKIPVLKKMFDFKEQEIKHQDGSVATFRSVVGECLSLPMESDRGKDAHHFYKLYKLGQKIHEHEFADLNIEELALIKERVTLSGHLITVKGQIYDMLEGAHQIAGI